MRAHWCSYCGNYGTHRSRDCPHRPPEPGAVPPDKWDLLMFAVLAVLSVALAFWLLTSGGS